MKSKFKIGSYFFLLFLFLFIGLLIKILLDFTKTFNSKITGFFVVILLFFVVFIMLIELRDKIIAIKFEQNGITINRFLGIKKPVFINNKEINGFHNSIISTKNGRYNYIYLIKGNIKIAKISEQYHKNFIDLSAEIDKRYKNLGSIKTNLISELKDMF
jgi:glucan phosphoethanolaminetransferase (alkaline phosphatase superfamily)